MKFRSWRKFGGKPLERIQQRLPDRYHYTLYSFDFVQRPTYPVYVHQNTNDNDGLVGRDYLAVIAEREYSTVTSGNKKV